MLKEVFTPVSSTNKTNYHDIAEILLNVALNTIHPNSFINEKKTFQRKKISVFLHYIKLYCVINGKQ
jgi:hypothetical protein